jgi:hypothetical protein
LSKERAIALTLHQTQAGAFFRLPVELEIVEPAGKARHQVWMDEPEISIKLPRPQSPTNIILDPDEKILRNVDR